MNRLYVLNCAVDQAFASPILSSTVFLTIQMDPTRPRKPISSLNTKTSKRGSSADEAIVKAGDQDERASDVDLAKKKKKKKTERTSKKLSVLMSFRMWSGLVLISFIDAVGPRA